MEILNLMLDKAVAGQKTKNIFIAAMSHELRNPLNSMLCGIEVLKSTGLRRLSPL
jgi:signal transduction histidine kinase